MQVWQIHHVFLLIEYTSSNILQGERLSGIMLEIDRLRLPTLHILLGHDGVFVGEASHLDASLVTLNALETSWDPGILLVQDVDVVGGRRGAFTFLAHGGGICALPKDR